MTFAGDCVAIGRKRRVDGEPLRWYPHEICTWLQRDIDHPVERKEEDHEDAYGDRRVMPLAPW